MVLFSLFSVCQGIYAHSSSFNLVPSRTALARLEALGKFTVTAIKSGTTSNKYHSTNQTNPFGQVNLDVNQEGKAKVLDLENSNLASILKRQITAITFKTTSTSTVISSIDFATRVINTYTITSTLPLSNVNSLLLRLASNKGTTTKKIIKES
ncbi:hypothetical protein JL193_07565 [Polaribacter batillariae]|uniref:Uncharacterized protein n=1 Tax=Polaribacter batillariae TaxID=2808900 RepID=A0ABX7T0P8_9FLAO|nr:hypothetical protein [Polaribacter batillariae]QTD39093.1 hypothetical protein JL193_07565 [Polaribacter batillariae]